MEKKILIDHYKDTAVQIGNILDAQEIAIACLKHMKTYLRPGLSREEIHEECARYMTKLGSEGWWIHNDPALILFGRHTAYSGREDPALLFEGMKVEENDLITIDVAPMIKNGWGDMARSFIMEKGKIIDWETSENEEIVEGMKLEHELHKLFIDSVNKDMTFSDLHKIINSFLLTRGYRNLDYHGNFGHTIENDPGDRVTIDKDTHINIVAYDKPITFEPHICKMDGTLGIKYENMYAYIDGKMRRIP